MTLAWRRMVPDDLDRVVEIAAIGFPDHFEGRDCFENRLSLWPQGCFVLAGAEQVEAYLVTYPWRSGTVPSLNALIPAIPGDATVLYLHDLALTPAVRGQGWSRPAMEAVVDLARTGDWPTVALVAVNDAVAFWRGHGFTVCEVPELAEKLASYGPDARYMTLSV
ncbi:GNAT family N-acetyltransferase [Brevundimonas sp. R86498]|uniref:GNAT family N-acetyltransferase n=1 Tax=Brevundimonas sp. R86498 TaxID=3093845 RepID=UPI0037C59635